MVDNHINSKSEIPKSPYYVTMTDKFMSGWGMAEDKTNKLLFVCDSYDKARVVMRNALSRSDMKFVNIVLNKPNVLKDNQYWQLITDKIYPNWYKEDFFNKGVK